MRLHSTTNIFRYDENIQFVNHVRPLFDFPLHHLYELYSYLQICIYILQELLPVVEKERNALSLLYGAEWRYVDVTQLLLAWLG